MLYLPLAKVKFNLFLMLFLDILDQGNGMGTSNVGCLKTAFSSNLRSELFNVGFFFNLKNSTPKTFITQSFLSYDYESIK